MTYEKEKKWFNKISHQFSSNLDHARMRIHTSFHRSYQVGLGLFKGFFCFAYDTSQIAIKIEIAMGRRHQVTSTYLFVGAHCVTWCPGPRSLREGGGHPATSAFQSVIWVRMVHALKRNGKNLNHDMKYYCKLVQSCSSDVSLAWGLWWYVVR